MRLPRYVGVAALSLVIAGCGSPRPLTHADCATAYAPGDPGILGGLGEGIMRNRLANQGIDCSDVAAGAAAHVSYSPAATTAPQDCMLIFQRPRPAGDIAVLLTALARRNAL